MGPVGRTARPKISSAESSGGNNKGGSTSTTRKSYNLKLEDEIVFSAGRYFRVFYGSSEGDKISLTLQRKFDKDTGWWTFEVISVD